MGSVTQYADEHSDLPWEICVFPGRNAQFSIYEDEGDGYAYETGVFAWRRLEWNDQAAELNIHKPEGSFPGILVDRVFRILIKGGVTHE